MKLKYFLDMMDFPEKLESNNNYLVFEIYTEKTNDNYPVYEINQFDKKAFIEWATFYSSSDEVVESWKIEFYKDSIHFVIFTR